MTKEQLKSVYPQVSEWVCRKLFFYRIEARHVTSISFRLILLTLLSLMPITYVVFAEDIPDHVKKLATEMGYVYEGMPKESLYQVFSDLQQKDYRKAGNEEWITFSDWTTEEPGDLITFHLVDGKVDGWEKPKKEIIVPQI